MTRPLAALERFFERLFERPAARLFRTAVEPVQIQHRLERAMDEGLRSGTSRVPDEYVVRLNPADYAALEELREALEPELAEGLHARARSRGYRLAARPTVSISPDDAATQGDLAVGTAYADETPPAPQPPATSGEDRRPRSIRDHAGEPRARDDALPPGAHDGRTSVFEVPSPRVPSARFTVHVRGGAPSLFEVTRASVRIGREADNDLVLNDSRVSRHHARLSARQGALVFTDLGSTNGSLVNGMPVSEVALGPGDVVQLGDTYLTVEPPADPA